MVETQRQGLTQRQIRRARAVCAALFVATGLTLFLPYYAVDDFDFETPRAEFTGLELLTGNDPRAQDADSLSFILVFVAGLGLTLSLLPSRGPEAAKTLLPAVLGFVLVSLAGCAALEPLDIFGPSRYLLAGFWLALVFLGIPVVIGVVLWRDARAKRRGEAKA